MSLINTQLSLSLARSLLRLSLSFSAHLPPPFSLNISGSQSLPHPTHITSSRRWIMTRDAKPSQCSGDALARV